MTEPSLLHNRSARRARYDFPRRISSYTLRYTQLDENNLKWVHVWGSFSHKVLWQFFKLFDFVGKVLHADISDGIPCLFVFFELSLVLRAIVVTNPSPDLSNSTFDSEDVVSILFRMSNSSEIFKISEIQVDTLVTTLDLLVFHNFVTTKVFHVQR